MHRQKSYFKEGETLSSVVVVLPDVMKLTTKALVENGAKWWYVFESKRMTLTVTIDVKLLSAKVVSTGIPDLEKSLEIPEQWLLFKRPIRDEEEADSNCRHVLAIVSMLLAGLATQSGKIS